MKFWIFLIIFILILVSKINSVYAQATVECVTDGGAPCSSFIEQLLQYGEEQTQTVQQTITASQSTITAVQETASALPVAQLTFQDLTNDVDNILGLISTANMIVGQTGYIINNLINSVGGYPIDTAGFNWHQQISNETTAIGQAFSVCGRVINLLQSISNDVRLMNTFINQLMLVVGRQQSLQNIGGELSQATQSLQKMNSGLMACHQGYATYYAAQQDRLAMFQHVNDRDLESSWVFQCAEISKLGVPTPAGCAGAGAN